MYQVNLQGKVALKALPPGAFRSDMFDAAAKSRSGFEEGSKAASLLKRVAQTQEIVGFDLALASDIRIASDAARFGAVFIKTGLSAADVGTSYFLPRLVGAGPAAELMLSGRIFKADEAKELRLASRVVAPEALESAALEMARSIAENAEYGVWMTKKTLWRNLDAPSLRHAMELENRTQVLGNFTGCMAAAIEAFDAGRKPVWKPL